MMKVPVGTYSKYFEEAQVTFHRKTKLFGNNIFQYDSVILKMFLNVSSF